MLCMVRALGRGRNVVEYEKYCYPRASLEGKSTFILPRVVDRASEGSSEAEHRSPTFLLLL